MSERCHLTLLNAGPRDKIRVMATQPIQSDVFRLDLLFRSDTLPLLRPFLDMWPDLKHLLELRVVQIRVIVDANVVQGELRWRLGSRENPQARSGLEEAIDAGVLVLIAPNFLKLRLRAPATAPGRRIRSRLRANGTSRRASMVVVWTPLAARVVARGTGRASCGSNSSRRTIGVRVMTFLTCAGSGRFAPLAPRTPRA